MAQSSVEFRSGFAECPACKQTVDIEFEIEIADPVEVPPLRADGEHRFNLSGRVRGARVLHHSCGTMAVANPRGDFHVRQPGTGPC